MVTQRTEAQTFARGSRVLDYWLAHAEGFHVRGGLLRRSRVEAVRVDPWSGRARSLVLRSLLHRRSDVPAEAVVEVDPFERTLVVGSEQRRRRRSVPRVAVPRPRVPAGAASVAAALAHAASRVRDSVRATTRAGAALVAYARPYAEAYARAARIVLRAYEAAGRRALASWAAEAHRRYRLLRASRELPPGVRRRPSAG